MKSVRPSLQHPPSTDRGVVNTQKGLKVLIDWFAFTLPVECLEIILTLLGISKDDFAEMPKGAMGYKAQIRCGHIAVLYDGREGMGIHVEISGKGCREYEARFNDSWVSLIGRVFNAGGHITRLDAALDDFEGFFTMEQLEEKVKLRELRSRHFESRIITRYELSTNRYYDHPVFGKVTKPDGKTIYFGSAKSDTQIRIYNKAVEQNCEPGMHWVRTEIQCRNERACVLARHIVESTSMGTVFSAVLNNYLAFVEPSEDSNRSRWKVCDWWSKFIGTVDKLKLSIQKAEKTIEQIKLWCEKQLSPTLALIFKYEKGDFSFFDEMLELGEKRLKPRHLAMLAGT